MFDHSDTPYLRMPPGRIIPKQFTGEKFWLYVPPDKKDRYDRPWEKEKTVQPEGWGFWDTEQKAFLILNQGKDIVLRNEPTCLSSQQVVEQMCRSFEQQGFPNPEFMSWATPLPQ